MEGRKGQRNLTAVLRPHEWASWLARVLIGSDFAVPRSSTYIFTPTSCKRGEMGACYKGIPPVYVYVWGWVVVWVVACVNVCECDVALIFR